MAYQSKFYGQEIDDAVQTVRDNRNIWSGKQEKLTGSQGQVVGFDAAGNAMAQDTGALVGPPGPQGPPGADGQDGAPGPKGDPGEDGFSPTVEVTDIPGGHRVTITDASGPHTFDVMDGQDGTGGGGSSGVSSFNGRDGAVVPAAGDYTAAMVGAHPDTWTPSAADVGAATPSYVDSAVNGKVSSADVQTITAVTQAEYDALTAKDAATLYLIKE